MCQMRQDGWFSKIRSQISFWRFKLVHNAIDQSPTWCFYYKGFAEGIPKSHIRIKIQKYHQTCLDNKWKRSRWFYGNILKCYTRRTGAGMCTKGTYKILLQRASFSGQTDIKAWVIPVASFIMYLEYHYLRTFDQETPPPPSSAKLLYLSITCITIVASQDI